MDVRDQVLFGTPAQSKAISDVQGVCKEFDRRTYERVCGVVPAYFPHLGHILAENMLTVVMRMLEETTTAINDAVNYPPTADGARQKRRLAHVWRT